MKDFGGLEPLNAVSLRFYNASLLSVWIESDAQRRCRARTTKK
jgi:hypothetical protein